MGVFGHSPGTNNILNHGMTNFVHRRYVTYRALSIFESYIHSSFVVGARMSALSSGGARSLELCLT